MSHLEESNRSTIASTRLTDEDYEAIIAKAETARARWENVDFSIVSGNAINYVSMMTSFLEGGHNIPLSLS